MYRCIPLTFIARRYEANIRLLERLEADEALCGRIIHLCVADVVSNIPYEVLFETTDDNDQIHDKARLRLELPEEWSAMEDQFFKFCNLISMLGNLVNLR